MPNAIIAGARVALALLEVAITDHSDAADKSNLHSVRLGMSQFD
jgi:hypothetical protein